MRSPDDGIESNGSKIGVIGFYPDAVIPVKHHRFLAVFMADIHE